MTDIEEVLRLFQIVGKVRNKWRILQWEIFFADVLGTAGKGK